MRSGRYSAVVLMAVPGQVESICEFDVVFVLCQFLVFDVLSFLFVCLCVCAIVARLCLLPCV